MATASPGDTRHEKSRQYCSAGCKQEQEQEQENEQEQEQIFYSAKSSNIYITAIIL